MNVLFLDVEPLYADLLPAGLRQIGCTVRTVTEVLDGQLDRELAEFRPDFVLTMGWSTFPIPERLKIVREALDRHEIPLIYWATEDPCWHVQWSVPYVHMLQPDLVVTICAEYVRRYRAMGLRAACLPFGYNHELYRPVAPRAEYECDIAVVANFYTNQFDKMNRKRSLHALVGPLLERGYDMKIWGNNWHLAPQFGLPVGNGVWRHYLDHRRAPAVYNSAKIVIGLQNEFDYRTNITMRTCEVLGSEGFLLTSRTAAVERMFEHGKHLVMSRSPEETVELVDFYLAHPDERGRIAAAGKARVRSRHTYAHRALELVELFERLRKVRPMRGACLPDSAPDDFSDFPGTGASATQSDDPSATQCDDPSATQSDGFSGAQMMSAVARRAMNLAAGRPTNPAAGDPDLLTTKEWRARSWRAGR
jgi:spore maturation protein CgeB